MLQEGLAGTRPNYGEPLRKKATTRQQEIFHEPMTILLKKTRAYAVKSI